MGCQRAGFDSVRWLRPSLWQPCDFDPAATLVVTHGLHGGSAAAHAAHRAAGHPVIIWDLPRLREEYAAIGLYVNDLQWLAPEAVRAPVCGDPLKGRRADTILVCGQKPGDAAHGMDDAALRAWIRTTIADAKATGLPVTFRPHPHDRAAMVADFYGADAISLASEPLADAFATAACVVVHNSTAGWEAIAAGVPVVATDPMASFADYTTTLEERKVLPKAKRAEALARCASGQATMAELADPAYIRRTFLAWAGVTLPAVEVAA